MPDGLKVEVKGIRELSRAFRAVDKGLPAGIKAALLPVAQGVAAAARSRASADFDLSTGRAAGSIKARASATSAGIAFGGSAAPYFPWLDFGGSTGRGHIPGVAWSGAIKREWKGNPGGEGRYVYPTIRAKRPDIEAGVEAAVVSVSRRQQFEVR